MALQARVIEPLPPQCLFVASSAWRRAAVADLSRPARSGGTHG